MLFLKILTLFRQCSCVHFGVPVMLHSCALLHNLHALWPSDTSEHIHLLQKGGSAVQSTACAQGQAPGTAEGGTHNPSSQDAFSFSTMTCLIMFALHCSAPEHFYTVPALFGTVPIRQLSATVLNGLGEQSPQLSCSLWCQYCV
jgi:hypothetical protein